MGKPTWDEVPAGTVSRSYYGEKDITYCNLGDGKVILLDGSLVEVATLDVVDAVDPANPTLDEVAKLVTEDAALR